MLDVAVTVSVQPSKLVRIRNVSILVQLVNVEQLKTVKLPTIELNVLMVSPNQLFFSCLFKYAILCKE